MGLKIKIFFILMLTLGFSQLFGQASLKKRKLHGKWDLDLSADSMKIGDTLFFKSNKLGNDIFLKRGGKIKQHSFYLRCGNRSFIDNFIPNPPAWELIGKWKLSSTKDKTILTMKISNKTLKFLLVGIDKKRIKFILQTIQV
jgi:hypothetical protein